MDLNNSNPVGLSGLEPPTSRLSGVRSNRLSYKPSVVSDARKFLSGWRRRDSNSRPPACKAGALPTELHPHLVMTIIFNCLPMGLSGLEPPTSRLSGVRSNRLSYKPNQNNLIFKSGSHLLSHTVSSIVSSAVWVLTIVFGMYTGVSPKRIATRIVFTS